MKKLLCGICVSLNLCAMVQEPGDQGKPALLSLVEKLFSVVGSCLVVTQSSNLSEASVKHTSYGTLLPRMIMHNPSQDKGSVQAALVKDAVAPCMPQETTPCMTTPRVTTPRVMETQDEIVISWNLKENITQ